ncbi:carbohydrate kinase [Lysinibacillus sp. BW-2-10]|uniref:carbohydrate kinase family protein n=1 Tax=Lysinibacillus sp. BW-2-10 TaxID=2590030 RepID=UPI001180AFE9|nr:carbohydrate kinase [Lysinibacillus sp. BW-2-10]TSI08282.1 carbohydrate kinase [Lysinibacillus sp. BW-2-10]
MTHSILCIGELLIDFFCNDRDVNLQQGQTFTKQAGGAPANVCAALAKLGGKAYFMGKVGADPFGDFLENTLQSLNVQTDYLLKDSNYPTTLAFVSLQGDGQRDFIFNRGADAQLDTEDISFEVLKSIKIMHFGSATALLPGPLQKTYLELLSLAKKNDCFISFDPNFRTDLWKGHEQQFTQQASECIAFSDFVKVSDEELILLTNETDLHKAVEVLHKVGANCIAVTLGKDGTFFSFNGRSTLIPSIHIDAIDTTGAGDAFVGALLFRLSKVDDWQTISFEEWEQIIQFSNKVGAIVCEKVGAIESLPTLEEVLSR